MLSEILVAQNNTSDSEPEDDCSSFTTVTIDSVEAHIQELLQQDSKNLSDLSENSVEVQDESQSEPETPSEAETIESLMRSYSGTVILVSNLDVGNVEDVRTLQQIWRSSIARWQREGRMIWIAYSNRDRTSQELAELTFAGFDIIIERGLSDLTLYCRSPVLHTNIAEHLVVQRPVRTTEHFVVIPDLETQLLSLLTSFIYALRRGGAIRDDMAGLVLSGQYSYDDYERTIAAVERRQMGTLFRIWIDRHANTVEINGLPTQEMVVRGVVRALALPVASFIVFEARIRRFHGSVQMPVLLGNQIPVSALSYENSLGNNTDDGYMADDESDDR
ncbi:hypothetical protein [Endozoicomonas lisbonensis]|uniref:CagE TrbE VirB component of type IV transporter system central domain-containing protein n=1 Tax=Endozoicomonas lisbonensis TaxID=3120522 RepID=A0ABV2SLN8_9GAMM